MTDSFQYRLQRERQAREERQVAREESARRAEREHTAAARAMAARSDDILPVLRDAVDALRAAGGGPGITMYFEAPREKDRLLCARLGIPGLRQPAQRRRGVLGRRRDSSRVVAWEVGFGSWFALRVPPAGEHPTVIVGPRAPTPSHYDGDARQHHLTLEEFGARMGYPVPRWESDENHTYFRGTVTFTPDAVLSGFVDALVRALA